MKRFACDFFLKNKTCQNCPADLLKTMDWALLRHCPSWGPAPIIMVQWNLSIADLDYTDFGSRFHRPQKWTVSAPLIISCVHFVDARCHWLQCIWISWTFSINRTPSYYSIKLRVHCTTNFDFLIRVYLYDWNSQHTRGNWTCCMTAPFCGPEPDPHAIRCPLSDYSPLRAADGVIIWSYSSLCSLCHSGV